MSLFSVLRLFALCAALAMVSACDSAEERAEKHFQEGLALLEEGDVARALVEFRNVFKLNSRHKEARLTYARLERERGNVSAAYGQYLRLIEQYPDNLEGRRALAEMALETGNWDEVARHGTAAAELAPGDPRIESINNALAYSRAIRDRDPARAAGTIETARALLETNPDLMSARQVLIDDLIRRKDWYNALDEIDAALASDPDKNDLYTLRLGVLQEIGDPTRIEAQIKELTARFPDNPGVKQMLVQHYIDQGKTGAAEQFLRAQADPDAEDHTPVQTLIAFLEEFRSPAAAISELDRIISEDSPNRLRFKAMRAALVFRSGDRKAAIGEMQELLKDAPRTEQTREIEVELARMLFQTGNPVGARALVENILEEDRTLVNAIKLKAAWLIEGDKTGEAIVLLREALGQAPRDPQLMTLMAKAHERNGDRELMGEMLALAVEVSLNAPRESLQYAEFLSADGDLAIAEGVLIDALRLAPEHLDLLSALGEIYVEMEDWGRLDTVIRSLGNQDTPEAARMANEFRARKLSAQQRTEELTEFLEQLTRDPNLAMPAEIALVRSMLARDDLTGALKRLDRSLKENPDSFPLRFIKAHVLAQDGKHAEAERLYRTLLEERPGAAPVWAALYALKNDQGAPAAARAVLKEALAAAPEAPVLLMAQAAEHERAREMDAAIEVYETLYALNSQSLVVANNLASLLTTNRHDDESLQRAYRIGRRLRGTTIPAFQDTYGWIAHRLGNYDEALQYLEPAAQALPDEPLVLYHLGKTYAALGRDDAALRAYRQASETAGDLETPPDFMPTLRSELDRLSSEPAAVQ